MFSAFNHSGVSQPYLPTSAIEAIRRMLDSAYGQTELGRALNGPVRVLECAQTARDIEVDSLRRHNDQLSRENELLKRVLEMDASECQRRIVELECQIAQERITARGRYVDVSTDRNRAQRENEILKKTYEDLTGKKWAGRTPKP